MATKMPVTSKVDSSPALRFLMVSSSTVSSRLIPITSEAQTNTSFSCQGMVSHDLGSTQLVAAVHNDDLGSELSQEQSLFHGRVAADHGGALFALEEKPSQIAHQAKLCPDRGFLSASPSSR